MSWTANNETAELSMAEGDFGVDLPITVTGATFGAQDSIKMTIKGVINGEPIIEKTFSNIQENTVALELTEQESALLRVGKYYYFLDWYQDGVFRCNIIPLGIFRVVNKA